MRTELVRKIRARTAGILQTNRTRLSLSREEVCSRVQSISPNELADFENGKRDPALCVIYELMNLYRPTTEEVFFFCSPRMALERQPEDYFPLEH